MEININTPETELHNIYEGPRGLEIRPGFVKTLDVLDIGISNPRNPNLQTSTSQKIIYAFSIESANSGDTYHYIFSQDSSNNLITSLYDSQFTCLSSVLIGKMNADSEPFSVAINYNQIIVNSRSIPYPLWGFIGGSLTRANKVESINPDTTALTLFPGRVCSFADRFAWAYANQVIFNDPGTEPRTITENNAISFGGTVLDLFQSGEGGNLIVVCTDATYSIPPDGLNGYQLQGVVSRIPGYQGTRSNNAATARGGTIGLVKDGIINIDNFQKRPLSKNRVRRYITNNIGPNASGDYRIGSLLATDEGFVITINNKTAVLDLDSGKITWYYLKTDQDNLWYSQNGGDINVVGILKDGDGKNIFVTNNGVIESLGNVDIATTPINPNNGTAETNPTFKGIWGAAIIQIPSDPQLSPVIREITTSADTPASTVGSYVKDSFNSGTIPAPRGGAIIGTAIWSASAGIKEKELRSRRMQRAIRADSPDVELSFFGNSAGGGMRIGETFDIVTRGIGKNRPTQ